MDFIQSVEHDVNGIVEGKIEEILRMDYTKETKETNEKLKHGDQRDHGEGKTRRPKRPRRK